MKEAADVMEDALKSVKIEMPCVEVISNVTAKPVSRKPEINIRALTYSMIVYLRRGDSKTAGGTSDSHS